LSVCQTPLDSRFVSLAAPRRLWAVSAIHGESSRLMALHDELIRKIEPGDRIVYCGNYGGFGPHAAETVDELLTFRRLALSMPGVIPQDFVYLRGGQEEMWEKLQQIQFAPNPLSVLLWMLGNGLAATLESYGLAAHDGVIAAQEGVMSLSKWTRRIRETVRRKPGHEIFATQLRRAAFTGENSGCRMLFVNSGIDPARGLYDQGDNFWWAKKDFNTITLPYDPFQKVVRGFDPRHGGLHINCVTATIDGGCGFGGALVCAGFEAKGDIFDIIEI
jgi:serine/threonine protein phosphatase 1